MTNINYTPNHIHQTEGNSTYNGYFGALVRPVQASPLKHHPHIVVCAR